MKDELRAMAVVGENQYMLRLKADWMPDHQFEAVACLWTLERQELSDPRMVQIWAKWLPDCRRYKGDFPDFPANGMDVPDQPDTRSFAIGGNPFLDVQINWEDFSLNFTNGAGVEFRDSKREQDNSLVAFIHGCEWLSPETNNATVYLIQPDRRTTARTLLSMKRSIEVYVALKKANAGKLTRRLRAIPNCQQVEDFR